MLVFTGVMARHQAYSLLLVALVAAASCVSVHARDLVDERVSTDESMPTVMHCAPDTAALLNPHISDSCRSAVLVA